MQYDEIVAEMQNGLKRLDELELAILAIKTGFRQCSDLMRFTVQIDEVKTNYLETDTKQVSVPCLVGDLVYHIGRRDKQVHVSMVKQILIKSSGVKVGLRCGKKGRIGKDIFLTEQEAEDRAKILRSKKEELTGGDEN